jgi:hypothetical protein
MDLTIDFVLYLLALILECHSCSAASLIEYKKMRPNKRTGLEWGQWDLNLAGKRVQLHNLLRKTFLRRITSLSGC